MVTRILSRAEEFPGKKKNNDTLSSRLYHRFKEKTDDFRRRVGQENLKNKPLSGLFLSSNK